MCGILGITKKRLKTMGFDQALNSLSHRGPDYVGTYEDEHICMNHLLLAIRGDISESVQPVERHGSPWVLAFNGQLYNTTSLRNDLGSAAPSTSVDTVLLFALIEKYGWDFITRIHGMFAIALYNKTEKTLRLYRDQSGQKNLYYAYQDATFMFASELKALLAFPQVNRTIDPLGVTIAASIGYIPGNRTLIEGVRKLHPSEQLTFEVDAGRLSSQLFISKGEMEYALLSPEEAMRKTIEDHLQSKQEISINLSGGLDSSLIFYESVQLGRTIHAFSTRFETGEEKYNTDATLAERLAKEYGQSFTPITITKETYLQNFVEAYTTIEEPNYNISVPIYYETAKTEGIRGKGLRVVLSGDGGDELFGGYSHYARIQKIGHYKKFLSGAGVNLLKRMRGDDTDYREISEIFLRFRALRSPWLKNESLRNAEEYIKTVTDLLLPPYSEKQNDMYQAMLLDRFVWLTSENFIRSDKLYMSQSMEMRCPLAYTPLRTYMDRHIPPTKYVRDDLNKIFLRKLYENRLPDYIARRKDKSGWRAPVEYWYDKKYKEQFLEIVGGVDGQSGLINWKQLRKDIEANDRWPGKAVHAYLSIAILMRAYNLEG